MSWHSVFLAVLFLLGVVPSTLGYFSFQANIPNGDRVPHPCKPNYLWQGVAHRKNQGGGYLNVFGKDFQAARFQWTRALCLKDSDGDGKTNGEELGDPECIWTPGQPPSRNTGLSHPGVCTPWDSAICQGKNTWVTCDTEDFECDAINEAGVKNLTIRFPPTSVPSKETTYFCQIFDLPSDKDYHLIATQPVIDNKQVMHHILIFGCTGDANATAVPESCGMADSQCQELIGFWTVGHAGDCLPNHVGFRFGKSSFKTVAMQFHWNNPERRSDYTDSSGMLLHYTDDIRTNDAGVVWVGQTHLEIPPGKERHEELGWCDNKCSKAVFQKEFHVFAGANHMHYLGRSQRVELFRNNAKVTDLTYDVVFSYDSPVITTYNTPIRVLPGDEIKTTCVFKSDANKKTVYYGDGTAEEMCFGFLLMYPADALASPYCLSWKSLTSCDLYGFREKDGCRMRDFARSEEWTIMQTNVLENCNLFGFCRPECNRALKRVKEHACFQGDVGVFVKNEIAQTEKGLKFLNALHTCEVPATPSKPRQCETSGSSTLLPTLIFTAVIGFLTVLFY